MRANATLVGKNSQRTIDHDPPPKMGYLTEAGLRDLMRLLQRMADTLDEIAREFKR